MARTSVYVNVLSHRVISTAPISQELDNVDGNWLTNDAATFLSLDNGAGATRVVTVLVPGTVDGDLDVEPREFTLAAGEVGVTGTFPISVYGNPLLIDVDGADVQVTAYTVRFP